MTGQPTLFDIETPGRRLGVRHTTARKVVAAVQEDTAASTTPATPGPWTLTIVAPARWLSANDSGPWYMKYRDVRAWRAAAYQHAQAARLPKDLDRVRIDAVLRFVDRRHRDIDNFRTTLKSIIDGLCGRTRYKSVAPGWGLIADDTPQHLDGPHVVIGEPIGRRRGVSGEVLLTITDLTRDPEGKQL